MRRVASSMLLFVLFASSAALGRQQATNPDAATISDFLERVRTYVQLQKKLQETLPKLPKEATPQQIDQHQRALGKLVQEHRAGAKPGDVFTPAMQQMVRRLLRQVIRGEAGRQLKKEIFEEYTEDVRLEVNGRYPDKVPLSTVPPQVLKALPELPEGLEYRFVGDRLILLDPRAHIIVDYVEHVLP